MISTFDEIYRGTKGSLPKVRTDSANYLNIQDTRINELSLVSYYKPKKNMYGRTSVGYLESMYAGVSSELLISRAYSNLAFGAEINYVKAREYDQVLKLRDLNGLSKLHGHVSTYWNTDYYDYLAQLDIGRYLAGDKGGTFTLSRNFPNGWEVGGFLVSLMLHFMILVKAVSIKEFLLVYH